MRGTRIGLGWCLAVFLLVGAACTGPEGTQGVQGPQGPPNTGAPGDPGPPGEPGETVPGEDGHNAYLTGAGLTLEILEVAIADAKATVTFKIADGAGLPLDREGLYTEGAVSTSFVLAWLDQSTDGQPLQYTAYTTRDQTSPITNVTTAQASADQGGTYTVVDLDQGIFAYELAAPVVVADGTRTHTLGAWATRDFEGKRHVANTEHDFLPSGGDVVVTRDIVQTQSCNGCHNPVEAHGGARRDVALCVLCHTPQTTDPDTGNTLDFPVMVHKIHRGEELPSVIAGTPYQIVGFQQAVHDYSDVVFPQEIQNCQACHTGSQGDNWKNRPGLTGCGSCHDDVSFADVAPPGTMLHVGGPQTDDTKCSVCHPPAGGLEGIETQHLTAILDPASPKFEVTIVKVEKTAPGETPEIVFHVDQNSAPLDILAAPMTRLTLTVAGPTTDYAEYWQNTIQGSGATGTLVAEGANYRYTASTPIPLTAGGSYAFGMEAYSQPGGSTAPRYTAPNPIAFAAVTDAAPEPRREVVAEASCNNCHNQLGAHGGARRDPQYCAMCHNPNNVNEERVSKFESSTITAPTVALANMVHKIHMGDELTQKPSLLYGFPAPNAANPAGTPIDFSEVRYPGDPRACGACHTAGTFTLPLAKGLLPSKSQVLDCSDDPATDADDLCTTMTVASETLSWPTGAACTGCHDAPEVTAHAETMTTTSGAEACATCHGPGSDFDVELVHALDP